METIIVILGLALGWISTRGTKSQWIRLVDILFLGPFMIYSAMSLPDKISRLVMAFFGATTLTYNLRNYLKVG